MSAPSNFPFLEDDSEVWFRDVIENHLEEARQRALSLTEDAREDDRGCLVTDTEKPRKVRFRGRQVDAYRFIYCVLNQAIASRDHVIRHRCHNRLCINPDHLEIGSQADNKRDDWANWAYGVDPDLL
ncbi:HNH endonuclease [Lutimaribacter saemankumensis]|uniref:HNH endonuclease n=1 Tax=Lutimaribacter saemankumensis TaxID=490829 RepID=A0A1G8TEA0_9RHOB|nr:HNH endonuclease [Lutimaribacter saemankumensis]SDJ39010.1 HNH endonuclease [Lutimaribacter saemankumensis]